MGVSSVSSDSSILLKDNSFYSGDRGEGADYQLMDLDECFAADYFELANSHSFSNPRSDYANEVFLYYWLDVLKAKLLVSNFSLAVVGKGNSVKQRALFISACNEAGIKIAGFASGSIYLLSVMLGLFFSLLCLMLVAPLFVYLLVKGNSAFASSDRFDEIYLIRSKAALQKASKSIGLSGERGLIVYDPVGFSYEDEGVSIYAFLKGRSAPFSLLSALARASRDALYFSFDVISILGVSGLHIWRDYYLRVAHKAIFEVALQRLIKCYPEADYYSGDKEDRFAVLETRVTHQAGVVLTCLPHGLEYGYKFPSGVCGSRFYTYTPEAATLLSALYGRSSFVYEEGMARAMLLPGGAANNSSGSLTCCFFTEPRDPGVNYEIIAGLLADGVKFAVKLHPLEDERDYLSRFSGLNIVVDYDQAISADFCLARKSTVLLESAARGHQPVAVLINNKDRMYVDHVFPSLQSDQIIRVEHLSQVKALVQG